MTPVMDISIDDFVKWCEESYLQLNLSKTKYMIIDFRKHEVTSIESQQIESVQSYKYLGTIIDSKLDFLANCEAVCKKVHDILFKKIGPFLH